MTARLNREFGAGAGRSRPGPARTVACPATPPAAGRTGDAERRGWELAQWAVAHAHDLKV